jgi:hypothetical protein
LSASYPLNSYPNYFPAFTNANSSGDAALYYPFFSSKMTVWQQAKNTKTYFNDSWCLLL